MVFRMPVPWIRISAVYLRAMLDSREANKGINGGLVPWKTHPVTLRVRQHSGRTEQALVSENDYSRLPHNPYPIKCKFLENSHRIEQAEIFTFAQALPCS
jgi:hypothetical protein